MLYLILGGISSVIREAFYYPIIVLGERSSELSFCGLTVAADGWQTFSTADGQNYKLQEL